MSIPGANLPVSRGKTSGLTLAQTSMEHYVRMILHRKWLVIGTCLVVTVITIVVAARLPDIYKSETLILVDPQKVPDAYVKATVTGDVRNRLSTLEQQILSQTRLQKIIDSLNLYVEERKIMSREEIITNMRRDITISLVSDFGRIDTLQAFKISFSGKEPRLVARVVSQLASLFIEENLKAREQQATGTTEFLESQLQETKRALESQEQKLREFRLKHIGEMPEQETADLQILGHLQSQLHLVGEALARAEQQRSVTQAMMSQSAPVLDFDDGEVKGAAGPETHGAKAAGPVPPPAPVSARAKLVAQLNEKLNRGYTDIHPDIKKLKAQIAEEDVKEPAVAAAKAEPEPPAPPAKEAPAPVLAENTPPRRSPNSATSNPILISQLNTLESEVGKQKQEQQRLNKQIALYQGKLEAIPVRQQEIAELVRDYEISKAHYSQLLEKQLSAETATQLEIRQKSEKFTILDPAQTPEKPFKPNRKLLGGGGFVGGLALGLLLALATEMFGMSITTAQQTADAGGVPVLEVIPVIETPFDIRRRKQLMVWATVSGTVFTVLACSALFFYRYRG